MIPRLLNLPFDRKSFFLFGPRQVGKSTLVKNALAGKEYIDVNLLKSEILLKYKTRPNLLRQEINFQLKRKKTLTIFIDEIQKAPDLLDEIHYLLEKYKKRLFFILTGSSARKLKRSSVNMLAGRAWEFFLFPLTHLELGHLFSLNEILLKGSLPGLIDEDISDSFRTLRAYANTYLKEEILDEALVRNIPAFSKFLSVMADQNGEIVNYANIARETGVSSKTIKSYYEILEDTLLVLKLEPYLKSARKRLVRHPKYYLFDLGVVNSLCGRTIPEAIEPPSIYGRLFEHFIILEIYRLLSYKELDCHFYHWRSAHGAEVDLVIEKQGQIWAIEIKSTSDIHSKNLRGLQSFMADYPSAKAVCVSTSTAPYLAGDLEIIPWQMLFEPDWLG
jgi:predicted AAA+ superfamily ATPase